MVNKMNSPTVDVATIDYTPNGPKLTVFAKGVHTSSFWDCCPLIRDQIRYGITKVYPGPIPSKTVKLPPLTKSAVVAVLNLSNRRQNDKSLLFTLTNLKATNPDIPDTLALELSIFSAINTLIHPSLTTTELLDSITHRVEIVDAKLLQLDIFLPHARFNIDLVKLGIRRVLEDCKEDDKDGLTVIENMCVSAGFQNELREVKQRIAKEKVDARTAMADAQQQQDVQPKFAKSLAPVWKR